MALNWDVSAAAVGTFFEETANDRTDRTILGLRNTLEYCCDAGTDARRDHTLTTTRHERTSKIHALCTSTRAVDPVVEKGVA
jgi:hypothetical protein